MDDVRGLTQPLDRYIDRFLYADGWRVTNVAAVPGSARYEVTITKTSDAPPQRTVTRSATSAGEATFMACSGARKPPPSDPNDLAWKS